MYAEAACQAHIDEVLELRDLMQLAHNKEISEFLALQPGSVSPDEAAVVGRAGYLFVNDGSNKWRQQIRGDEIITAAEAEQTAEYINSVHKGAQARGIRFLFVAVPEKDVVYPELSPNAERLEPHRSVHRISAQLHAPHIYPLGDMLRAKGSFPTYHARNSHVSFYGGLVLANALLAAAEVEPLDYAELKTSFVYWPDDLSMKWVPQMKTGRRILSNPSREEYIKTVQGHVGTHLRLTNEAKRDRGAALVFGDSYSWNPDAGVARFLSLRFGSTDFVWGREVDWDLVDQVRPALLVLELAERFLVRSIRPKTQPAPQRTEEASLQATA